jgi:hypothetical protein
MQEKEENMTPPKERDDFPATDTKEKEIRAGCGSSHL